MVKMCYWLLILCIGLLLVGGILSLIGTGRCSKKYYAVVGTLRKINVFEEIKKKQKNNTDTLYEKIYRPVYEFHYQGLHRSVEDDSFYVKKTKRIPTKVRILIQKDDDRHMTILAPWKWQRIIGTLCLFVGMLVGIVGGFFLLYACQGYTDTYWLFF